MSASSIVKPAVDSRVAGWARRFAQLSVGLIGFGIGIALLVRARLGLDPWDVLNQGIARHLGIQIGWVLDAVGALVLLAWIPLHQRLGVGTLCNVVVIGLVANGVLDVISSPHGYVARGAMLGGAIALNGVSTACYLGAGLGAGPRDGLMVGFAARGHSIRVVRTLIEVSVLVVGFALGGSVGVGTVAYALLIGPIVHLLLPRLSLDKAAGRPANSKGGT